MVADASGRGRLVNRLTVLLAGAVAILFVTALTVVVDPYLFLSRIPPESKLTPYTADQAAGRKVYVSMGCVYCHSQQPRDPSFAPDGQRGWGRPPTPGDYANDYPHQLGTMRTGPDLFNIGARQKSAAWHYAHLYNARTVSPGSTMPSFPFLFEVKPRAEARDLVVDVPPPFAPGSGVVVAREEAKALVAYLLGLDHTYPSDVLETAPVKGAP